MKNIAKWLYFLGLLIAIVVALVGFQNTWISLILVLLGIFVGIFFFDSDDVVHLGIRYLVLGAVYSVLGGIPVIGTFLTGIFGAVFAFLGPVVLTVLVVWFVKKYFLNKE
jgi:hypothetical protein